MAGKRTAATDRKIDPVALTALVLSLIAAGAQVVAWWRGPLVRLIPPDRVALYAQVAPHGNTAIRIAAHMSYANVAQAPYGDLVLLERAYLKVGAVGTRQRWNSFGEIKEHAITRTGEAAPQPLPGQSAVSHVTLFTPVPQVCPEGSDCDPMREYLSPQELAGQLRTSDRLQFRFEIKLFDDSTLSAECHVPLSDLVRDSLANVVSKPFYAMCHRDKVEADEHRYWTFLREIFPDTEDRKPH